MYLVLVSVDASCVDLAFKLTLPSRDDGYVGSVKLPDVLRNTAHPTSPPRVAFKEAMQTDKPYFDWLSEQIQLPDGSVGPRPNYEIFSRAMHGLGPVRALATYHGSKSGEILGHYPLTLHT